MARTLRGLLRPAALHFTVTLEVVVLQLVQGLAILIAALMALAGRTQLLLVEPLLIRGPEMVILSEVLVTGFDAPAALDPR